MAAKTYNIPELDTKLADRRYHLTDANPEFTQKILKTSRTIANMCYQCGICPAPPSHQVPTGFAFHEAMCSWS